MLRLITLFVITLLFSLKSNAQDTTFVYFNNNTDLIFSATTTGTAHANDWDGYNGNIVAKSPKVQLMIFERDYWNATSSNGTYSITTTLTFPTGETVDIQFEYNINWTSTTTFRHSAGGTAIIPNHPWRDDRTIYEENTFTVNGVDYILRYQSYSPFTETGSIYDNVFYSIYEADDTPYTVNAADAADPDIFNLMSYNVFMRPLALFPFDDQTVRANHIADYVHGMDAIVFQELFENTTRATLLANLAAEYPYQTTVVDAPNLLEDGGIVIVSKWPIEVEDQYLWGSVCFEDDCTANKGVGYARINKLGKKYHVFGTHMDAFNKDEDVNTRKQQLVDWKAYIDSKAIPSTEAVLMAGDYNVDKFANKFGEYDSLWGNFAAKEPVYLGYPSSWDPTFNSYNFGEPYDPEFLDYVLSQEEHLPATTATNDCLIMRSNHIDMWRIFDLSDHYAIWGRFEFPSLPVELTEITGKYDANKDIVTLNWTTASEENNQGFMIGRSLDGETFITIGEVAGNGNSQSMIHYEYEDLDAPKGLIYYRLRQMDFDGTEELSEIVSVVVTGTSSITLQSIYPNPAKNKSEIQLDFVNTSDGSNLLISVQNSVGKKVFQKEYFLDEGKNTLFIPIKDWTTGVYFVQIMNEKGNMITQKINIIN